MSYYIFEVDFGIIYKFILSKFPVGSLAINQCAKKACALAGSTFGIYSRL